MRDPAGLLEDAQKRVAVDRVAPKGAVHHAARVVQGAQGAGRQVLEPRASLVDEKSLQDGVRIADVKVVAGDFDQPGLFKKTFVDGARVMDRRAQSLLDVEQQDLAQLRNCLGGPVVTAHQCFAGTHGQARAIGRLRAVAKRFSHCGLQVKHQTVLAPACSSMEAGADETQQGFVALNLAHFEGGRHAAGLQLSPSAAQARGL